MKKENILRPVVKTHGGKNYVKWWVIENFPENYEQLNYCEPMCAGASVFLNKKISPEEIINDIDDGLIAVFKALRDEPKEFISKVKKIKYEQAQFEEALERAKGEFKDYVEHGINEYVIRRMSRGGMKKAFAWSERERGGKPGDINAWETMIEELPNISARIKKTTILNKSMFDVVKFWDESNTLFYLDPPYLHSTRTEGCTSAYEHEMSSEDHVNLLHFAKNSRGKVIISGYSSPLYTRSLKGWRCKKKNVANHSGQGKTKERRVEILWMNY